MTEIKLMLDDPRSTIASLREGASGLAPFGQKQVYEVVRQIQEQTRPAIQEPTELGAVVVDAEGREFVRHTRGLVAPWIAAKPDVPERPYRYFAGIKAVEVLRVGVGAPPPLTDEEIEKQAAEAQRIIHAVNSVAAGEIVRPDHQLAAYYDEMNRLDAANAQTDAYAQGRDDFALALRKQLTDLHGTVITAPEKRVADQALKLIAAALGSHEGAPVLPVGGVA